MTRKSWLPDGVTDYRDRHGKARYRWRRKGYPTHHFRSAPGTPEFMAEYHTASGAAPVERAVIFRGTPGTFDDLCERFYASPAWKGQGDDTKRTYRGIIERFRESRNKKGERRGGLMLSSVTPVALDTIFGTMSATPAAANNLRKVLKRMFRYAVKVGLTATNPVDFTEVFKSGPGWHTWTDGEIQQYRDYWANGTKARLALELALNTAARRCNVAALERSMFRSGKFHIAHVKGCDATVVEALPETLEAIAAMPVAGIGHYLVTEFGKPFTAAGFGNKFREWCDKAKLKHCSIHGLRKATSRRLAERGATDAEGVAVTGHKKDKTFAHYRAAANRERLADSAMRKLAVGEPYNPDVGEPS